MRSHLPRDEQAALPFDPPAPTAPPSPRVSGSPRESGTPLRHRMADDALASLGWPAGTELVLGPCRAPRRGQVVLARDGKHLRIGIFEVQLGRAALRTDHGSTWIGPSAQFLGAVTIASAPLAGMPQA